MTPRTVEFGGARFIINVLRTGEISIQLEVRGSTMGGLGSKRQTAQLRFALLECLNEKI